MFVPLLKASESLYSYIYRLASFNSVLTAPFFHKYILLKNGNFVNPKKASDKLYELVGESHSLLFEEASKRAKSAPNSQLIASQSLGSNEVVFLDEKNDKSMRYCPDCISEQLYYYGHSWLRKDWMFNHRCLVHGLELLSICDTSDKLGLSLFDTFMKVLDGNLLSYAESAPSTQNLYESRSSVVAPCVLVEYFKSTRSFGFFDFNGYEGDFSNTISLFYQYLNSFPENEKDGLKTFLNASVEACVKNGFYFYKTRNDCLSCPFREYCTDIDDGTVFRLVDEVDVRSILASIFQSSSLPVHIGDRQISIYSDLLSHVGQFFEPSSYEADTVEWLFTLMRSTFATHSELIFTGDSSPTFSDIKREPISGLLVLSLKRERIDCSYRTAILSRDVEDSMKRYIDSRFKGQFNLEYPLLVSKVGLKSVYPKELNKMFREAFKVFNSIKSEGKKLHSIRDIIAVSAILSGANMQYVTKASGLAASQLIKENILPV
ncbi:hypothetical protein CEG15_13235 [Vibrio anguillarum]|uniref:TniQ family protein n=1 Tax=Vibrio anguillarum TaxID=55601 RepID=UPI000B5413A2|nr:TniQ family protein [Vibrio anguillarum]ASG01083.1 hypothetical protein CEG15_13235 [Vibrio anguillarum]